MQIYKWLSIVLFFVFICNNEAKSQCDRAKDSLALVSFFESCQGVDWANKTNWLVPGRNISTWFGVKLNAAGCVESLILPSNKINGGLPPEIRNFQALKILTLTNNNLSGNLIPEVGSILTLEELNLSGNKFNGSLPSQLRNLSNLKKLLLSVNNLSGNVPFQLGNLSNLKQLHLNQNSLNGSIPPALGNLGMLEELLLSENSFDGNIPTQFGNLSSLTTLVLSNNNLTGSLPASLGNLSNLSYFYADDNLLSGSLPPEMGKLSNLRELYLHRNGISGSIPVEFSNLLKLQKLLLNENKISGILPPFIGNLTNLISLHLSDNQLTGVLPDSFGFLDKLISFLIENNNISGVIPLSFGNLKSLSSLNLSNNNLTGEIPSSFGNISTLRRIYIQNNNLEGCFPNSMQKFCTFNESTNPNVTGYNFKGNNNLVFAGDFKRWCAGEGRAKAAIIANTPLCEGSTLSFIGSGGITFSWSGPNNFGSNIKDPSITSIGLNQFGTYKLIVINENKCADTTTILIESVGNVTASGGGVVCEGVDIKLKSDGGLSYKWFGPNNFQSVEQNPILKNAVPSMAGVYKVEIKTADCTITREVEVSFQTTGSIQNNSPICEGDTLKLLITEGLNYSWTGPLGFKSTLKDPSIVNTKPNQSGTYTVVAKSSDDCVFTLITEIKINQKAVPSLVDFEDLCSSDGPTSLPSPVDTYQGIWSGTGVSGIKGNQVFTIGILKDKQSLLFTPDKDGRCVAELRKEFFVSYFKLLATENSPSLDEGDTNGSILLTIDANTSQIDISYTSNLSIGTFNYSGNNTIISGLSSGNYLITALDANGCTDTSSVEIRYLKPSFYLPNAVSSFSNSVNGTFYLKGSNVLSYDMEVFDRWGNQVFRGENLEINEESQAWSPSLTDTRTGVYVYVMTIETFTGRKLIYGSLTVI